MPIDLPKEIIEATYPNLVSKDGKTVNIAFNNGKEVAILTQSPDGIYKGDYYTFNPKKNNHVLSLPKFSDTLVKLNLSRWNGQWDDAHVSDYNNDSKSIQVTVNNLVDDNFQLRDIIQKIIEQNNDDINKLTELISITVSNYLNDKYYNKEFVDKELDFLKEQIKLIQQRLPQSPKAGIVQKEGIING